MGLLEISECGFLIAELPRSKICNSILIDVQYRRFKEVSVLKLPVVSITTEQVIEALVWDIQARVKGDHQLNIIKIEIDISEPEPKAYAGLEGVVLDSLLYDGEVGE